MLLDLNGGVCEAVTGVTVGTSIFTSNCIHVSFYGPFDGVAPG